MKIVRLFLLLLAVGCGKKDSPADQIGKVTGTVKDAAGSALSGVKIIVDNSIFFNSNLSVNSDTKGMYAITLPSSGSWYAFALYQKQYNGKVYSCYLHPDDSSGFGREGAVRHFTWKLTGSKAYPLSGHYGGLITFDHFPGVYIDTKQIQFTLIPEGKLIDGSDGQPLVRQAADGFQVLDVPIGRYRISARYGNDRLKLRQWNSEGPFVEELVFDFEPQIDGQCDNCFKIEYNQ